jgi:hypothetical protein
MKASQLLCLKVLNREIFAQYNFFPLLNLSKTLKFAALVSLIAVTTLSCSVLLSMVIGLNVVIGCSYIKDTNNGGAKVIIAFN